MASSQLAEIACSGRTFPTRRFSYSDRDALLYALSIGMGRDPADVAELDFVYERNLKIVPSLATVIAWDDDWLPAIGLDLTKVVHGEQRITLHRPLPPSGELLSTIRILNVFDKGPARGAVLCVETQIVDFSHGKPLATLLSTVFARGDGGFGGPDGNPPPLEPAPDRPADRTVACDILPNQAFLYRLLGDRNPLHVDREFAARAGFDRPILHGLCTFGMAARAIVIGPCGYQPERLRHFAARFTAPAFPGDTLTTEIWNLDDGVAFRCLAGGRIVLDRGRAVIAA